MLTLALTIPLLILGYHYLRNGWLFVKLVDGGFPARLMWCATFVAAYLLTAGTHASVPVGAILFLLCYIEILVPHGYAMDMGRCEKAENKWPSPFPVFNIPQDKWDAMTPAKKELVDVGRMTCIGFIRGGIVFAPLLIFGLPLLPILAAVGTVTLWHPASYWVGYRIPLRALNNAKNSAEWGEFLLALGWAAALYEVFGG